MKKKLSNNSKSSNNSNNNHLRKKNPHIKGIVIIKESMKNKEGSKNIKKDNSINLNMEEIIKGISNNKEIDQNNYNNKNLINKINQGLGWILIVFQLCLLNLSILFIKKREFKV